MTRAWVGHARALLVLTLAVHASAGYALDIHNWRLDNGARVFFVQARELPMVQFIAGFDAGSARDPASRTGLASMVSAMLDEGAAGLDAERIAQQLESVGAQYGARAGRGQTTFELRSVSHRHLLDPAVSTFAKILRQPTFPEDQLLRVRAQMLTGLERARQSPRWLARRAFYKTLFSGHVYANHSGGTVEDLGRITRDDLLAFHRRLFVGANGILVMVGDLSHAQARRRARQILGRLPRGGRPPDIPRPQPSPAREIAITFPSKQTHVMIGALGISRDDPDYFPLYVGNHILGGNGLVSRLGAEIRERRGLVYGVSSYFVPMRRKGPFAIALQTHNDRTRQAMLLASGILETFIRDGPTGDELEFAKDNITGGFALGLDSNREIANTLLLIAVHELPLDYLDRYAERINAVTVEQIKAAFRRHLDPDRLIRVSVGGG